MLLALRPLKAGSFQGHPRGVPRLQQWLIFYQWSMLHISYVCKFRRQGKYGGLIMKNLKSLAKVMLKGSFLLLSVIIIDLLLRTTDLSFFSCDPTERMGANVAY